MYAVVEIKWHQYLVKEGDTITIDRIDSEEKDAISFDTVLLGFSEDGKTVVHGTPTVEGASVTAKVVDHTKWKKMKIIKFEGKKRYKRTKGFTPKHSVLSIEKVKIDG